MKTRNLIITLLLIGAASGQAHESRQKIEYPGFRPPTEYATEFAQNIATSKVAIFPTITRYVQPRENKISESQTRVALDRIVKFMAENNLGIGEPVSVDIELGETTKGGQFAVFNQTIETIGGQLGKYPGDADYILMLDIIRVYRDAWGIHCYILDREGRNVFSFLLNSHHKPFVDAAIQIKTGDKEGREKMYTECTELILQMLHRQISMEREISAYRPDPAIAGRYIGSEDPAANYLVLKADGSFEVADDGHYGTGTYAVVAGNTLVLIKDGQYLPVGCFEDGKLITHDGEVLTNVKRH